MPEIKVNDSLLAHADALSEAAGKLAEGVTPLSQGKQQNRPAAETIEATERFTQVLQQISRSAVDDIGRIRDVYYAFQSQDELISGSFEEA